MTNDLGPDSAQPERETVIKFVISGPFLNAEAAHTQWAAEPAVPAGMHELLRRLAELETKLEEERARVEELLHHLADPPAPPPIARPADPPQLVEPEVPRVAPAAPDPAETNAAPAPPRPSTAARTPPPKVRGLRRMIGALRHL